MRRSFGRYVLVDRLASGPSSDVYRATLDPEGNTAPEELSARLAASGDRLAVKIVKAATARDPAFSALLLAEADAAVHFRHRAAAGVLEVGHADGELFVAMELVEGELLSTVLDRTRAEGHPLAPKLALTIGAEIASVLAAMHRSPWSASSGEVMVHGAIAPDSVLLTWDGRVKVLGVGLGRSRSTLPPPLERLAYRAPEVLESGHLREVSDVYSLGVVLYDLLASTRVFARTTRSDTEGAVLRGRFERLGSRVEYVGALVDELVFLMMSRTPEARPESAEYVERALRSQLRGASPELLAAQLAEHLERTAERSDADSGRTTEPSGVPILRAPSSLAEPRSRAPSVAASPPSAVAAPRAPSVVAAPRAPSAARPASVVGRTSVPTPRLPLPAVTPPRAKAGSVVAQAPEGSRDLSPTSSGAAPIARAAGSRPPTARVVGRYELVAEVGLSGCARIFDARVQGTGEPALVKVLDTLHLDDARLHPDEWVAWLGREVALARRLTFPGLPRLLEVGQEGTLQYVAYDRADGTPLPEVIGKERLDEGALVLLVASLADALAHLHERGIVHANVRAQAILRTKDGVGRFVDLSYMFPAGGAPHPLLPGNVFVLSPEYLEGAAYGPAGDQFALGALVYELLTGTRPFRGLDDATILAAIRDKTPRAPTAIDSRVSPGLSALAMRALEKAPTARFASLAELAARVRSLR